MEQLFNCILLFRLVYLFHLRQFLILVGVVVTYYHHHGYGENYQQDNDTCQLAQLAQGHQSDEHHQEDDGEKHGRGGQVFQTDEEAGGQGNPHNPLEGIAVSPVLTLPNDRHHQSWYLPGVPTAR